MEQAIQHGANIIIKDNGVCTVCQNERIANAHGHNSDGSVGIAHDHGEQHHANGVHHDTGVHIALGDDMADQIGNDITDTVLP